VPHQIERALEDLDRGVLNQDQQDAHELFQLLSSGLAEEIHGVMSEDTTPWFDSYTLQTLLAGRSKGSVHCAKRRKWNEIRNPFVGLLASRLTCVVCGYTEAIRHFTFDNLSLTLPNTHACRLEECLAEYTHLELLDDASCRRCLLSSTLAWYKDRLQHVDLTERSRRELEEKRRLVADALQNDLERELVGVKMHRKSGGQLTKQVMIAKCPQLLCLHLNRTDYFNMYAGAQKNSCRVRIPYLLNLAGYVTTGHLSTHAHDRISALDSSTPCLYRLRAVVIHYGSSYDGHFVTYRVGAGELWWRVSDERVTRAGLTEALDENPYLVFYEKVAEGEMARAIKELGRSNDEGSDREAHALDVKKGVQDEDAMLAH